MEPANKPQMATIKSILNTADPTIVPRPMSLFVIKTPITEVNNSGAELPAAMKVAPATSECICNLSVICSREGTK